MCGLNSAPELLGKGENENCRVFKVDDGKWVWYLSPVFTQLIVLEDFPSFVPKGHCQ